MTSAHVGRARLNQVVCMSAAPDQAPQTPKHEHGTKGTSPQIRETTLESGGTRVFPLVSVSASAADTEVFHERQSCPDGSTWIVLTAALESAAGPVCEPTAVPCSCTQVVISGVSLVRTFSNA